MESRRAVAFGGDVDDNVDVLKPLTADDETASSAIELINSSVGNALNRNTAGKSTKLRIKCSYGDMEIEIPDKGSPQTTSVAQLKSLVRKALTNKEAEKQGTQNKDEVAASFQDRHLRLICKGRLLSPDESVLSEFKVADQDVVHAVLGPARKESVAPIQRRKDRQRTTTAPEQHSRPSGTFHHLLQQHQRRRRQRPNRGIGTIVGPGGRVTRAPRHGTEGSESSDDDSNDDPERGRVRERRGFDRLRGAGLSRQEITAIRTYFNRHVDRYIQQQQQQQQASGSSSIEAASTSPPPSTLHLDEPDLSRRRLLVEEEWMATQGAASEFRLNLNQSTLLRFASLSANGMSIRGTRGSGGASLPRERPGNDWDFMWGFCLGLFVGVIALVWVWMPRIPHKQKLGILTGICFQVILETSSHETEFEDQQIFDNNNNNAYDDVN